MRILMTGSSGFIGSALKKRLELNNDVDTIIFEHFIDAYSHSHLRNTIKILNPDVIYHLGAYGNHSHQDIDYKIIESNITGTFDLLGALHDINYKAFYNFSSSSVTLETPTLYSASKKCAELLCNAYRTKYNKNIINIRPYSVFGEGEAKFRFIPTVIRCLLSGEEMQLDENATHDWIYINDFIDALLSGKTEIGTGIKRTNKEVVTMLEEISGKKLNYKPAKLRAYDNDNWYCKKGVKHIPFKESLKNTFDYYAK